MPNDPVLPHLSRATARLQAEFSALPDAPPAQPALSEELFAATLDEVAARLGDNYPYFHPLYAGQMLKPPHPIARAAYALAMNINPNNHARDGGRASSAMEVEAVAAIARMFGWGPAPAGGAGYLGHLTSSGTIANLEALWVAGQTARQSGATTGRIVGSAQAHYTHQRISAVLQLDYRSIVKG